MSHLHLGIIGCPIRHSLSPVLHTYLLQQNGQEGSYRSFETQPSNLAERVSDLLNSGIRGFNVTIPLKQEILPFLTDISNAAKTIGAVNTVLVHDNRLHGHNTDSSGFMRSLQHSGIEIKQRSAIVLGAGGASRAVIYGLLAEGISEITIANRTLERARNLAVSMGRFFPETAISVCDWNIEKIASHISERALIVNTTSVGMWPDIDKTPFVLPALPAEAIVVDLVYNPLETQFIAQGKSAGASTIDGLNMFIFQGVAAFEIWLGRAAIFDLEVLRNLLLEKLASYE